MTTTSTELTADVKRYGTRLRVSFFGLVVNRIGSSMGPNRRGIVHMAGYVGIDEAATIEAEHHARAALAMLGIEQEVELATSPDSWGDAMAKAKNLPPEGGRIELPDGSVIEVVREDDEEPS